MPITTPEKRNQLAVFDARSWLEMPLIDSMVGMTLAPE
jgi:hypothetical protein